MGSRADSGNFVPIINPPEHPWVHVVDGNYVGNLWGVRLTYGNLTGQTNWYREIQYQPLRHVYIPILPPIESLPPPSFDTESLVDSRLDAYAAEILEFAQDANVIALLHGSYFGFLPEAWIAQLLANNGFYVHKGFPRLGGRKRVQEHGVIYQRAL